jgi:hypothetical protein
MKTRLAKMGKILRSALRRSSLDDCLFVNAGPLGVGPLLRLSGKFWSRGRDNASRIRHRITIVRGG